MSHLHERGRDPLDLRPGAAFVIAVLAQDDKSPALSELIDRVRRRGFMEFSPAVYKGLRSIAQTMVQG